MASTTCDGALFMKCSINSGWTFFTYSRRISLRFLGRLLLVGLAVASPPEPEPGPRPEEAAPFGSAAHTRRVRRSRCGKETSNEEGKQRDCGGGEWRTLPVEEEGSRRSDGDMAAAARNGYGE
uniref:Uncharacterized protein n=1 Tax=Arundo donax TaxID=35708 RepID=A0A0A9FY65_ARUDO